MNCSTVDPINSSVFALFLGGASVPTYVLVVILLRLITISGVMAKICFIMESSSGKVTPVMTMLRRESLVVLNQLRRVSVPIIMQVMAVVPEEEDLDNLQPVLESKPTRTFGLLCAYITLSVIIGPVWLFFEMDSSSECAFPCAFADFVGVSNLNYVWIGLILLGTAFILFKCFGLKPCATDLWQLSANGILSVSQCLASMTYHACPNEVTILIDFFPMIGLSFLGLNSIWKTIAPRQISWIDVVTAVTFPAFVAYAHYVTPLILARRPSYFVAMAVMGVLGGIQIMSVCISMLNGRARKSLRHAKDNGQGQAVSLQLSCYFYGSAYGVLGMLCYYLENTTDLTFFGLDYHGLWHILSAISLCSFKIGDYISQILFRQFDAHLLLNNKP